MADINEIHFSGTIERLQAVTTKTGNPMARWLLSVGRDKFKCACFGNLADAVLQCHDGDRITVNGSGSINSWKDAEDHWHNDFQVTVWTVEIDGQQINYQKADTRSQQMNFPDQPPKPDPHGLSEFDATPVDEVPF